MAQKLALRVTDLLAHAGNRCDGISHLTINYTDKSPVILDIAEIHLQYPI
jgi:hypothetical protein